MNLLPVYVRLIDDLTISTLSEVASHCYLANASGGCEPCRWPKHSHAPVLLEHLPLESLGLSVPNVSVIRHHSQCHLDSGSEIHPRESSQQ